MDAGLVIVGAGPAGCATALFVHRAAPELCSRLVLIDRAVFPRDKTCAGAVGRRADRLLAAAGVRIDVPSLPICGLSVATAGGQLSVRRTSEEPIGRVVARSEFDAALLAAVQDRGIEVVFDCKLEHIERRRGACLLHTTRGQLCSKLVAGADGVGSAVRRSLGLKRGQHYARAVETTVPSTSLDPPRDLLHFDLTDRALRGYGWTFPAMGRGSRTSLGVYQLVDPEAARPAAGELADRLRRRLAPRSLGTGLKRAPPPDDADLGRNPPIRHFAERGFCPWQPVAAPRVLLVGEAAGIDPVLGEGVAQSIAYGSVAGPYLAARLSDGEHELHDWRATLYASRVGRDLRRRAWALPWLYGPRRAWTERWVGRSRPLAELGQCYFAGDPVPTLTMAHALGSLAWSALAGR